jgi:hypothetical protein
MRVKLLILFVAAVLLTPALATAQIGQTATLSGIVTDASGAVLPGVTVSVSSPALIGGSRTAVTDGSGAYRFPSLPPGLYTLKVELEGFKPITLDNVGLQLVQTISLDESIEVG